MCGRFTLTVSEEQLEDYLNLQFDKPLMQEIHFQPRYNIAPSQQVIAVIYDGKQYRVGRLKWGFTSGRNQPISKPFSVINIRQETMQSKPMFKEAYKSKRCLILADGFYEWHRVENNKQAYHITLKNETIFTMAGLWDSYLDENAERQYTCGIITTASETSMAKIHDRKPLILDKNHQRAWLEAGLEVNSLDNYEQFLQFNKVSSYVNRVQNDDHKCIESIDE